MRLVAAHLQEDLITNFTTSEKKTQNHSDTIPNNAVTAEM